jgi:hypothetical protein
VVAKVLAVERTFDVVFKLSRLCWRSTLSSSETKAMYSKTFETTNAATTYAPCKHPLATLPPVAQTERKRQTRPALQRTRNALAIASLCTD